MWFQTNRKHITSPNRLFPPSLIVKVIANLGQVLRQFPLSTCHYSCKRDLVFNWQDYRQVLTGNRDSGNSRNVKRHGKFVSVIREYFNSQGVQSMGLVQQVLTLSRCKHESGLFSYSIEHT